jgi:CRP-like cAMP-binding protein
VEEPVYIDFKAKLNEIVELDAAEINLFFDRLIKLSIPKGGFVLRSGDLPDSIYFVSRGLLRTYIQDEDREIITDFFFENEFAGTFTGFLNHNQTTALNIQALEDSEVFEISSELLQTFYHLDTAWLALGKYIFEKEFLKKRKREHSFLRLDAKQRYLALIEQYPQIEQRVSLRHISSHLRIQPESLSRIRSGKYH